MTSTNIISDAAYLFDFGFSMHRFDVTSSKTGLLDDLSWSLTERYTLPRLEQLTIENPNDWTMRGAWHERGLMFELDLSAAFVDTKQPVASRSNTDARTTGRYLQLYIDTRGSSGIKRANHFCYRIRFDSPPPGSNKGADASKGGVVVNGRHTSILKASEDPPKVPDEDLLCQISRIDKTKERWRIFIRGAKLYGYNPIEFPEIGFFFCCYGSLNTNIHLARSASSRFQEDPSNWCRVKLV
ncbi:hypothetical protein SH449x_002134 [Pirellulaceae bacterium SH449]